MPNPLGRCRDPIFFASGFAGLIYESIWTHYLRLFLGHAAYAQTLVLAIFMGGMAIGAALTARYTTRLASPLRVYALVEAMIGAFALVFHPLFTTSTGGFYDIAFDAHLNGFTFEAIRWGLGTALILPQSILLGATFPLFASADTRSAPAKEGRSIATLYFANSLGGAAGVLTSGFVLIPALGLFGTVATAGALNLAIAGIVLALSGRTPKVAVEIEATESADKSRSARKERGKDAEQKRGRSRTASAKVAKAQTVAPARNVEMRNAAQAPSIAPAPAIAPAPPPQLATRILLAVAFFTGASSFIYEIGWIRMLSLVLGSATHSFELMLSSFVLGLALGGLWIRKRIDTSANPGVLLGYIQIAMGGAALATVPLHSLSFDLAAAIVNVLPKTESGYTLFNTMRYGIASLIMFPAAFCAGMTLPLVTRLLYSTAAQGERAIGVAYSANTVGAIVGLALAINVGMPLLGLEYLVASGAVIDVVLGALLLGVFGARPRRKYAFAAVLSSLVATAAVAQTFDPQKLASGVFRSGRASTIGTVLEVAHGKTATVSIEKWENAILIKTNGKTDAAANRNRTPYVQDQVTMALIGAVPLLIHEAPRQVANVGFGSGLTSNIILADPRVLHLDTIEIEPKIVQLARHFDPLNRNVYTDARSAIRIEDAKSFFAANGKTYDVITSEPSNPWVSGVASLFSVEFYRHVSRYLNKDGLFAQWLQTYETHPDRVVSVLKAMAVAFDDYLVVGLDSGDLLLVGRPQGKVTMPPLAYAKLSAAIKSELRDVEVANQSDIALRIIGNKAMFQPWLDQQRIPVNSDFAPYLDSNADRDRFFSQGWREIFDVAMSPVPLAETMGGRPPLPTPSALSIVETFGQDLPWAAARMLWEKLFGPPQTPDAFPIPSGLPPAFAEQGTSIINDCIKPPPGDVTFMPARLAQRVLPYLSPGEGRDVLNALRGYECLATLPGSHVSWRLFLDALAVRDPEQFGVLADQMLVAGEGTNVNKTRYLLAMAMLGRIGAGKPERARALWTQFSPMALREKPADLVLQILYAHAVAGIIRPQ